MQLETNPAIIVGWAQKALCTPAKKLIIWRLCSSKQKDKILKKSVAFLQRGHKPEMFQGPSLAALREQEEVSSIMDCVRTANIKYSIFLSNTLFYVKATS